MAQIIEFPKTPNYAGRILALNPEKAQKFQCGGFWLGPRMPAAAVPGNAQMEQLYQAVLDGRLIEVGPEAIKTQNAALNPVRDLDTDKPEAFFVYRVIDGVKCYCLITPKDKEQEEIMRQQLKDTGKIDFASFPEINQKIEAPTHLSAITITDMEPEPEHVKPSGG